MSLEDQVRAENQEVTLECEGCGFIKTFDDPQDAFDNGWDCPPFFEVVTCFDCPSAPILLKKINQQPNP